jgi:acetamidase/formamidase
VVDFMEALDLRDVTLVGNDTGGAICQIVVAEHPKRIGRLVLTNCDAYEAFFPLVLRPLQCGARLFQEAGRQETTESRASYFTESWEVISMSLHSIEPERATLHGQFSPGLEPALTVDSGDTVSYSTLDVAWGIEHHKEGDLPRRKFGPRESPRDDGPCLVGPVAVRGAEPGSVLEVHVEAVEPGTWGWTVAGEIGFFNGELNRALGVAEGPPRTTRWRIDTEAMVARSHYGRSVRLRPFLGTIGLSPGGPGWHSAWPPGCTGGNLDCKELIAGSTLYLPVAVPGALVSVGDGHAAQGDGEVSGTGIECPMERADLRYVVRNDLELDAPRARTPGGWITFGFSEDLDEAATRALKGMLDLMARQFGLCRKDILALASLVVDLRVTQLVNGVCGVHAVLPHEAVQ